ncbi:MAG: hypothetical protein JWM40_430 [Frankiales bacterium]|nr:hypothetical protein [Frankiales bacterium]
MANVEALRSLIEAERERFGVPGVAIAVVADGEVVLAEGFGRRDLEADEPVTADTHFPIASDTKAFTAALLCLLADEGAVDLDAPVRSVLPWFEMADPHATALVSARDLLSHRTGLPRHDFVWYGETDLTLEDVARRLRHLPLSRPPRQTWQYNNLCFNTAGYLTEVISGQSWDAALRDRLLEPLGMSSTVLSAHDPSIKAIASPYKQVGDGYEKHLLPGESKVLPAGGIVSTIEDMSKWLLARLGAAPDVLSTDALAQLHGPAMIGGVLTASFEERQPMGYALGCQVESYRGRRVVRHGGNLVGFSSDVAVVPGTGIGVVVLTNLHGTYLREALPLLIIDQLLGNDALPWGERYLELMTASLKGKADALEHHAAKAAGSPPSRPLTEFAGSYEHPAYGTFSVSDEMVADFHGLGDRIRLDHRSHDAWDLFLVEFDQTLPVVFRQADDGSINGVTLGIEPTVEPILFTRAAPAADPGLIESVLGTYQLGPHTLVVRMRGEQLVARIASQGELVLESAGGNRFTSPTMPSLSVEAERSDDGLVRRLVVDPVGVFERA